MFSYTVYGLGVRSVVPLPELPVGEASPDITIRRGPLPRFPFPSPYPVNCLQVTTEGAYQSWEGVGAFLVRDGHEITFDPDPGVDERLLRSNLLGRFLAVLLHQRRLLVLHASAVVVGGGGAAFLGECGQGKSTLAASFHARGRAVVDDDFAVVAMTPAGPRLFPGVAQISLCPDAAAFLGHSPEAMPRVHGLTEKRAHPAGPGWTASPLSLRCLYVLGEGPAVRIEPLTTREAFVELVRHTFVASLLPDLGAVHFRQCAAVAERVPVRRLWRPRSLALLPELVRVVEADLAPPSDQDNGRGGRL